jgi:zinc transport system substrate-binding protein
MSPRLACTLAQNSCDALIASDPARKGEYIARLDDLLSRLKRVDDEIHARLDRLAGRSIFVFHPAYGYFLDEFGLRQVPVEFRGSTPGPRYLTELVKAAKEQEVKVIFVQPQQSTKAAGVVADAIGAELETLDPLAGDYIENLRDIAARIEAALAE